MESRAKLAGHPVHPMLVVFPLGLLGAAAIFDTLAAIRSKPTLARVGYWNTAAGLAGVGVAAPFGVWDWLAIPDGTRAKQIGLYHAAGNLVAGTLFGASWLLRRGHQHRLPSRLALTLELTGSAVSVVSGWLGGELVDRLGVGVDEGAHLDASNSISGRSAREIEYSAPREASSAGANGLAAARSTEPAPRNPGTPGDPGVSGSAPAERRPSAGGERGAEPTTENVLRVLRERFGDQYEESYEHGKRDFSQAVADAFRLDSKTASTVIDDLERSQTISFHRESTARSVEGPRVGLFDTPGASARGQEEPDYGGRYWRIGEKTDIPGLP